MYRKIISKASSSARIIFRTFRQCKPLSPYPSDNSRLDKVTICGAKNPLGEYLAFLLKRADIIRQIALYDEENMRGVALDLEHMNTKAKVRPYSGDYALSSALKDSDLVVITNGFEATLEEYREETLKRNAATMYKYAMKIAGICPEALVCIITPPINIMVPIFSEAMKMSSMYDPKKVFGVCSLFEMRANTTVAEYLGLDPAGVKVPIIGGATPRTAVPLFSQAKPYNEFRVSEMDALVNTILESSVDCKKFRTAAPLSTAYALSRFVLTLAMGLCTCDCAIQTAYVRSDVFGQVKYFASSLRTSTSGAVLNYGIPKIHEYELTLLSQAMALLECDLRKAQRLFEELQRIWRKEDLEDLCRKPFIKKSPVPPCPACYPTNVCQEKLPENPCSPLNKAIRYPV